MPLDSLEALLSSASFVALGTSNTVAVTDAAALADAVALVKAALQDIDAACSRFRPDSELSRVNREAGGDPVALSPLLEDALRAAFDAAAMTGGLVDLTVGAAVQEAGYTVTFRDLPVEGPPLELRVRRIPGWRALEYDARAHALRLPAGASIDLGASGKAWAADVTAELVTQTLGCGVLVDCGGDIAVRGEAPRGGWPVRVAADVDAPGGQDVTLYDGGLATSGTAMRRWRRGGVELHHIIDPTTGLPAETRWAMVSVAAATCVEANAAATAALILDGAAAQWLGERGLPGRLVGRDGAVEYVGGWSA